MNKMSGESGWAKNDNFRLILVLSLVSGILILSSPEIVFADNFVAQSGTVSFILPNSGTGGWKLVSTNANQPGGDSVNGCNASTSKPVTLTINTPSGLTATPSSLSYTSCSNNVYQTTTFSATSPGTYIVTVSATGGATGGNFQVTPGTITVTVTGGTDTNPPIISSHADVTKEATGSTGAVVDYTSPTCTDNIDLSCTVNCAPSSGSVFALGETNVICSATDTAGNTANSSFKVTVVDTTAPTIASHGDETAEATGPGGADVSYTNPTASDLVDGNVPVNCSPSSGSTFALGDTTVNCSAQDNTGNIANSSFKVTVEDTTAPTLTIPSNFSVDSTDASGAVVNYDATASDLVDGNVPVNCSPSSGSTFALGDTTVNCSAQDNTGNIANSSFKVTVLDKNGPTLAVPGDQVVEATSSAGVDFNFVATASDVKDGTIPVTCSPSSGSTFGFGDTTVSCSATDSDGNTANSSFKVTVVDTTAPTIASHGDETAEATGPGGADVSYTNPTASDLVDGNVPVNCSPSSGSTFALGDTTVNCSAQDNTGNIANSSFKVTVEDTTAPTLTIPSKVLKEVPSVSPNVVVEFEATASDIVDLDVSVTCDPNSGTSFAAGVTTVNCTATDDSGNSSSGSFDVYAGRVTFTGEPYSVKWNKTLPITANVIGYEEGSILEIKRGTTTLVSSNPILGGNANLEISIPLTLPAFPPTDSGTTVNIDGILVSGDSTNYGSDTTGIQITPHATSLGTLSLISDGFPGDDLTAKGIAVDTDDSVPVNDLQITFTGDISGLALPISSITGLQNDYSSQFTITDAQNFGSGSNLIVHPGTEISNPNFNGAQLTIVNAPSGTYTFEVTPIGQIPTEVTRVVAFDGFDADLQVYSSGLGGIPIPINNIKLVSFPSSTLEISRILVKNSALHTVHDINLTGGASGTSIIKDAGSFSSFGELGDPGSIKIKADFAGNAQYLPSSTVSNVYSVASGLPAESASGLGDSSIIADSGKGVAAITCSTTVGNAAYDTDGDSLCDNMETSGVPFTVWDYAASTSANYNYVFPSANVNVKNVYVESDQMSGHTVDAAASANVVSLFNSKGITLYHDTTQSGIAHQEKITLWTDSDTTIGNDFDSFKNIWFGGANENIKFTNPTSITCSDCSTSGTTHNIKINGMTITTPNTPLTGGKTSGVAKITLQIPSISPAGNYVQKGIAPTITAGTTGAGLATKAMTVSDVTVTNTGGSFITISVPFSTAAPVTASLGEINLQFKTSTSSSSTTFVSTTTSVPTQSGSPYVSTSLLDARAQGYHYIPWLHTTTSSPASGTATFTNSGSVGLQLNTELGNFIGTGLDKFATGTVTITQGANSGTATFTNSGLVGLQNYVELSGLSGTGLTSFVEGPVTISQVVGGTTYTGTASFRNALSSPNNAAGLQSNTELSNFSGNGLHRNIELSNFAGTGLNSFTNGVVTITQETCGATGQSELPGNDGVISLGCSRGGVALGSADSAFTYPAGDSRIASVGTTQEQAGTFLHELAHNMGINHGGPQKLKVAENGNAVGSSPADVTVNCKPNYLSVMSYPRQMPGYVPLAQWVLNLSSGGHSSLTESSLSEPAGVTGSAGVIVYSTPASTLGNSYRTSSVGPNIDWDDSGAAAGTVQADINNFGFKGCDTPEISTVATYDWNDWGNLEFNLRSGSFGQFDGFLGELQSEQQGQIEILNSYFPGFYNPPPYDDATKNTAKAGSSVPIKVRLYTDSSKNEIITWAQLRGEFSRDNGNTYEPMLCTNSSSDKLTWNTSGQFNQCDWKLPSKIPNNTKLYMRIWLDTSGANPPEKLLRSPSPNNAYTDGQSHPVTNYVKITSK